VAITRIGNPAIADQRGINFRNIIINGGMDIAQRSTSVSGITSTSYNTVDRWNFSIESMGTWTQSQSTDVPTGQGFSNSLKIDCTTADASPSAQYLKKGTANAESLTASFWVKSNKTGTYICEVQDTDNTRQISKSYTINSANTWEKKTVTFPGDTTGAFVNDNLLSLAINFWLGVGSDFTSGTLNTSWNSVTNANRAVGQVNLADSTSNEWYITGVQLEAGQVASDFEFLPNDVNLQRCYRYCYAEPTGDAYHSVSNGHYGSSTLLITIKHLPVALRNSPSLTTTGSWQANGSNSYTITGFTLNDNVLANSNSIQIRATLSSGGVGGQAVMIRNLNDATATFILNAEL
jgi:hypothetical protein